MADSWKLVPEVADGPWANEETVHDGARVRDTRQVAGAWDVRIPVLPGGLLGFGTDGGGVDGEREGRCWFIELSEHAGFIRVVKVKESVWCVRDPGGNDSEDIKIG